MLPSCPVLPPCCPVLLSKLALRKVSDALSQFSEPGFLRAGGCKKVFQDPGANRSKGTIPWSSKVLPVLLRIGVLEKVFLLLSPLFFKTCPPRYKGRHNQPTEWRGAEGS